uniref:J domain-containing protein n=1 Tax=Leersia perrieri TaxID=77586 RepID=A0A0D9W7V9_9ORYZ
MFGYALRINNTKYYEVLGVPKTASQDELKSAYRKAALKSHPDKGGDPDQFKEYHKLLSDPEKRDIYNQYGEDTLKEGMEVGSDFLNQFKEYHKRMKFSVIRRRGTYTTNMGRTLLKRDFLNRVSIFGDFPVPNSYIRSRVRRQRHGDDMVHTLNVSLEDVYNGSTKKQLLSRNILCPKCQGKGTKSGAPGTCYGCHGTGVRNRELQYGLGELISDEDKCTNCRAIKVIQEEIVLEVHIEKGMQHGQKIVFQGKADEAPDTVTGDIVFILQVKEHPRFKRKCDDLFIEHTISLTEALCGLQFILTHLDGRKLLVRSNPGEIIKTGQHKAINDEGMPHQGEPFMKGCLFVEFNAEFPESSVLSCDQCRSLEKILSPKPLHQLSEIDLDRCEEAITHDVNIEEEMRHKQEEEELMWKQEEEELRRKEEEEDEELRRELENLEILLTPDRRQRPSSSKKRRQRRRK